MNWTANLVPIAPFVMIVFIVWFVSLRLRAENRNRTELQKELLTKFSSAQELAEFLKTDGGKLLMPAPERRRTAANTAGTGVLVLVVGFGLLAGSWFSSQADIADDIRIGALLAIAAGIGLLISAVVTQKLSQKWNGQDGQVR
jgi:hypothetical protein